MLPNTKLTRKLNRVQEFDRYVLIFTYVQPIFIQMLKISRYEMRLVREMSPSISVALLSVVAFQMDEKCP